MFIQKSGYLNSKNISKFLIIFLLSIFFLYLAINLYKSFFITESYRIDFSEVNFKNKKNNLYINEEPNSFKFQSFGKLENATYAEINEPPISFIWKPKIFPLYKNTIFSLTMMTDKKWFISPDCVTCTAKQQNSWQHLYTPKLNEHILSFYNDNFYIYTTEEKPFKENSDIDNWLKENVKENSEIEIATNKYKKSQITNKNIDYKKNVNTHIEKTFRGHHEFYVYLPEKIKLEVEKKDLNLYEGSDEIYVELYDVDQNLIFQETIDDDGIISKNGATSSIIVTKTINKNLPQEGIYKLVFAETKNNLMDWTINRITINTNKIVLAGNTNLILDPTTLYTEIENNKTINVYAWHNNAKQTITFNAKNAQRKIEITDKNLGKWEEIELENGAYNINLKGDQHIGGNYFSIEKEQFFQPFIYDIEYAQNPKYIITGFFFKKEKNWIKISKTFSPEELKGVKNLKEINFKIKEVSEDKTENLIQNLKDDGFEQIHIFDEYLILGKEKLESKIKEELSLTAWILNNIPQNSTIKFDEPILNEIDKKEIESYLKIKNDFNTDFVIINNTKNNKSILREVGLSTL